MTVRRAAAVLGVAAAAVALIAPPALARPEADFEMPFACGQEWTGSSRASHSPSAHNVDWNRPDDLGQLTVSSGAGVVTRVEDLGSRSYGLYLVVDHGSGESTLYAHLDAEYVSVGQRVDQGQVLGRVGDSGGVSGPHLHYEQRLDGRGQPAWFGDSAFVMGSTSRSGSCVDIPIAGDWTGDAKADLGVFRRNARGRFLLDHGAANKAVRHEVGTDDPLVGDWEGDGSTDVGVHRSEAATFLLRTASGTTSLRYGASGDQGVAGDWDGDGVTEIGVWRPRNAVFRLRASDGRTTRVSLGSARSLPVTGDWDADGRTDLGVYDAGTWSLWLRRPDGTMWTGAVGFGGGGELPVTGDWNGDGVTDLGVWSPETATFTLRRSPALAIGPGRQSVRVFGRPR